MSLHQSNGKVPRGLSLDHRGTIMVEYTVLLTLVSVGLVLAVAALGVPLVRLYLVQRTLLLLPFP